MMTAACRLYRHFCHDWSKCSVTGLVDIINDDAVRNEQNKIKKEEEEGKKADQTESNAKLSHHRAT